jgi:hypothetical protein
MNAQANATGIAREKIGITAAAVKIGTAANSTAGAAAGTNAVTGAHETITATEKAAMRNGLQEMAKSAERNVTDAMTDGNGKGTATNACLTS